MNANTRKKHAILPVLVLAAGTAVSLAQLRPGIGQTTPGTPGAGQPQPGTSQPGTSRPGVGQPDIAPDVSPGDSSRQQASVDDSTLRREVHEQLARQEALANVHPTVRDGVVYLQGSVPTQAARMEARKAAESVQGVRGVKEELTINPHSGAAASSTTGAEQRR